MSKINADKWLKSFLICRIIEREIDFFDKFGFHSFSNSQGKYLLENVQFKDTCNQSVMENKSKLNNDLTDFLLVFNLTKFNQHLQINVFLQRQNIYKDFDVVKIKSYFNEQEQEIIPNNPIFKSYKIAQLASHEIKRFNFSFINRKKAELLNERRNFNL